MKYSDLMTDWLCELGYTHCFYVAGGNVMHLLESISRKFKAIPVVHEVAAGIAAEYFNEIGGQGRAFALVTAGPGVTNIVTAVAGAYLESRDLLVIGGQVKVADLSRGQVRQRGIQEVGGVEILKPITKRAMLLEQPLDRGRFAELVEAGVSGRKGPVFVEIPLDVQARDVDPALLTTATQQEAPLVAAMRVDEAEIERLAERLRRATRPVLLLGGGVARSVAERLSDRLPDQPFDRFQAMGIPIMTTWNAADRIGCDHPLYFGRPNTWGQRYANLLLQQADLVVALGTRLGLQQTGFNWQEFAPVGDVVQVDCDPAELDKGHPGVAWAMCADANAVLSRLARSEFGRYEDWVMYCRKVKQALPLNESANRTAQGYVSPYEFALDLSALCGPGDVVIPCSSGSANSVMMQAFCQKQGQRMVTNKGLASMGYGLSGAIGAAFACPDRRTVLVEGDGGFAQNVQEIGTVAMNRLNLKIFIFDDGGYASIRMTQSNYFGGRYVGCDRQTGLGLPDWEALFSAYRVPVSRLQVGFSRDPGFLANFTTAGPAAFIVPIDPAQTYFPKISSRMTEGGGMASNPLHLMSPPLDVQTMEDLGRFLA
jgi:acetolactate synthase I/II/III large subunit